MQARPCIIQPGNFTGWGSEGVNYTELSNTLVDTQKFKQIKSYECIDCIFSVFTWVEAVNNQVYMATHIAYIMRNAPLQR